MLKIGACGLAALRLGLAAALLGASAWVLSWRLVWRIPSDIAIVCFEALAQLVRPRKTRGVFRATAFKATANTPPDTGRRALAETVGSFAPNTIVVGVDVERGLILTHQLRRQGPPEDLDVTRLG